MGVRQQQAKNAKDAKDAHATRKVLTNEDLPAPTESASTTSISTAQHNTAPASPASNDTRAGERWKATIEAQKNSIASLQRATSWEHRHLRDRVIGTGLGRT